MRFSKASRYLNSLERQVDFPQFSFEFAQPEVESNESPASTRSKGYFAHTLIYRRTLCAIGARSFPFQ
jgi:hypothetical protein